MPVCDVCNGEDYYEEDGQFYCNVCNTQSQSMVVMELDETFMQSLNVSMTLREIKQTKQQKEKKCEYEQGRPWTKYEAFQLIMKEQARALIDHKADPSVREVVLRLWAKYLSLLRVAFVNKDEARLVPIVFDQSVKTWERELSRGGMENPEVNPRRMKRRLKKHEYNSYRTKIRKLEEKREKEMDAENLQGETFYEGDNPLEENDEVDNRQSGTDSEDSSTWSDIEGNDFENMGGRDRVLISVQRMTLSKTLAFTYLACIFASRWITVSDILRWVCDGSMPYLETTHLLRPDMKLSAYDKFLFTPVHMTSQKLRFEAGRLLHFLGFEKIPDVPLKYICVATIQSLDLPEALIRRVVKLLRVCPVDVSYIRKVTSYSKKTLVNFDAACAAYVLVTIKQIFGLDDCRERILSKYTKALQARLNEEVALFDWDAWQVHITSKLLPGLCLKEKSVQTKQTETSVEKLCQTFKAVAFESEVFANQKIYTKGRTKKVPIFQKENREMLKHSANILEERWKNREDNAARIRAEEHAANGTAQFTNTERLQEMSACLRTSILDHILKPAEFIHSVLQKQASSDSSFPPPNSEDDPTTKTPASLSSSEDPSKIAFELLNMLPQASVGQYIVYHRVSAKQLHNEDVLRDLRSKQHYSYKWLLKILSRWTFCPETDIEMMVWAIESQMFSESLLMHEQCL